MLICLLVLLSAGCASAAPTSRAVRVSTPPTLDGKLDDEAWRGAGWNTDFTLLRGRGEEGRRPERAPVQTRFKVVFDEYALFVAVECDEPDPAGIKADTPWRDGAVWQDDCIEVFFDPGNEGRYYHQVMVNSRGVIYDCHAADYGLVKSKLWNGAFRAVGAVDEDAKKWRVELAIPFGTIVLGENPGATWKWNLARERQAGGKPELSTWSPMAGGFHQPRLFGALTGVEVDYRPFRFRLWEPDVEVARTSGGQVSLHTRLRFRNETGRDRRVIPEASLFEQPKTKVQTKPVTVVNAGETVVDFPPLTFRGSAVRTSILFALREADSKRLLAAAVKSLSTEYRPLSVLLLRPCYRNSIYPSERLREIVFRVDLSARVRQASRSVRAGLVGDSLQKPAVKTVSPEDLSSPLSLPARNLAVGRYRLIVEALDGDGKPLARRELVIRKLPPAPGNEVRIDEHRRILVDGRPLLGIGWYGGVPTGDPRQDVVALQNVQTPVVVSPPDDKGIREAFDKHGIYSIVSVENGRLFFSFKLWQKDKAELGKRIKEEVHSRSEPSPEVKDLVRRLVESVRDNPGLLGYYIADEPEIHNLPSAYLENYYLYLSELDPYHPVFVTNDTIDGIVTHGYKCADVIDPDPYSSKWEYVPNFLKKFNEVARPGQALWVTLWHSSTQAHMTSPYGTAPPYPYEVFRNQYFASLCYGATGFTAYTSAFFLPEIEYRYGLPYVWRELRFLEPAILAPPSRFPVEVEGAPGLATLGRVVAGHRYLIAVNHSAEPKRATLRWEPLSAVRTLHVLSEGREVPVRGGAIADAFTAGAVHVYTDDPAASEFPTTAAVRRELDERKRKAVKPGNLLHASRGVRVRCSQGYFAPWFHQYFYYAVNGLTDDIGWSAYAWQGKPTWMEIALPKVAHVGRVVIYTPNLKDYQLDFIAPGGERRRASITGNEAAVAVHNFRPPVPCLKLRLTVTAITPADCPYGDTPLVREIEAYAEPGQGPVTQLRTVDAAREKVGPLFATTEEPNTLWREDFTDFQTAPRYYWKGQDTKWVLNAKLLRARPLPGGRLAIASQSPKGYAGMTHIFPYRSAYRFFQVKLDSIEGSGYRFTRVGFADSSGKPGYRVAVNTAKPGIYTVDTHYIHENFRTGKHDKCFLSLGAAGSKKKPDGTAAPGPEFTFDWLQLVRRPVDGLIVTLCDGSPLPPALKQGDCLHFEVHLQQPAQDAVVEVRVDARYAPLAINGRPYVQLVRADKAGRLWVGEVTLGPGTGKYKPGYPVLFKATFTGGAIQETFASAVVTFQ